MAKDTKIEWCDASWGAWWGCTKVSSACDNCYAETMARRVGYPDLWGVNAGRRTFGQKHWAEPLKWNRDVAASGRRFTVFCNSMADVFDNHSGVEQARKDLWHLIAATPALTWILLTKRIGNAKHMLPADWGDGYPNVWMGISVCNQPEADRDIVKLLELPAQIRFLSCEPLLGRIDLDAFQKNVCTVCAGAGELAASGPTTTFPEDDDGMERCQECQGTGVWADNPGLNWVIAGGESGSGARPMDTFWALHLRQECADQGVAFFMKQLSQADTPEYKNFARFHPDLQVRQWP